ncbi:leucine-rich repeats and immunoglobulin-like domains protein 3 [Sitophilus oryzae]|uniref:Leucine-rich repeats and immunoglobulin-like domains protein 3 n=1 Tax=Sitophilus oryzae TaxID=7048 RepID=A0A6J2Y5Y8_SITOR|nr:leucine-rich repeats and immunoglobulin-like domains protein 3 [Sitophilus oryzae]
MMRVVQHCYVIISAIIIVCQTSSNELREIQCPEYCDCDVYQDLNRAVCQNQNLVTLELGIPEGVRWLDISFNQIKELTDGQFVELHLTDLKLLNLSNNKLYDIHFNAFKGLEHLKTLDLSFNAVEYFNEAWFESLSSLEGLYLRGNKLKSINKQPLISLKNLRELDISQCGIIHLNSNIFSNIPRLQYLDISDNYLTTLRIAIIKPLKNLTNFIVSNNNFICSEDGFNQVKKYTKVHNITYIDPCSLAKTTFEINNEPVKFQKMMMEDDFETTTLIRAPKNLWLSEPNDVNETCNCDTGNSTNSTSSMVKEPKALLLYIIEVSPWLVISVTFFYGFFIGIIIACCSYRCLNTKRMPKRNNVTIENAYVNTDDIIYDQPNMNDKPSQSSRNGTLFKFALNKLRQSTASTFNDANDNEELMLYEFVSNSTPMPPRKDYVIE